MSDIPTPHPNRQAWIIAGAILVAAGLIVGVMVNMRAKDDACRAWQAQVQQMANLFSKEQSTTYWGAEVPADDGMDSALMILNAKRPENCPHP